jgi:tetratricopeptide (TPR) repeat protein
MTTRPTGLLAAALGLLVATATMAAEPLTLIPYASSDLGDADFLSGMPITLEVYLVNQSLRDAEEAALAAWRETAREAERAGAPAPSRASFEVDPAAHALTVGETSRAWFDDVSLSLVRMEADGAVPVLTAMDWSARIAGDVPVVEAPLTLERQPAVTTLRLDTETVSTLAPGTYRLAVSRPGTNPGTVTFEVRDPATDAEEAFATHMAAREALLAGDAARAIELASAAVGRIPPDRDTVHATLGRAYEMQGDIRTAIVHYQRFLEMHADATPRWHYPKLIQDHVSDLTATLEEENR